MLQLVNLVLLVSALGVSSFVAGLVPLRMEILETHMKYVTALSLGILAGTALAIVVPEGLETLFESAVHAGNTAQVTGLLLLGGFAFMSLLENRWVPQAEESFFGRVKSIFGSTLSFSLVVHSAVDGVALAASFFNDDNVFQVFFFVMIIVHKLPTAFSLAVVLKKEMAADTAVVHLLCFAVASPVLALVAYLVIFLFNWHSSVVVGVLLLVSAGTFLYAVLHVMGRRQTAAESLLCTAGMAVPALVALLG